MLVCGIFGSDMVIIINLIIIVENHIDFIFIFNEW